MSDPRSNILAVGCALNLCALILSVIVWPHFVAAQEEPGATALERDYQQKIQPLLERYCYQCHAQDVTEAQIDLSALAAPADLRNQVEVWLKVREMLDSQQMPPQDAVQPSDSERKELTNWVRAFLAREAQAGAGDPGPVVLRRLSNAEYTYSVRDLTGVESLDPTREFPVDGAAGEGFTNSGEGQAMSPALIAKYLDAAKEVAAHAVLLPDGICFSPHVTHRDQTEAWIARIQNFYRQFTEEGGGTAVNLQGIQFDTNTGGLLPLGEYVTATLAERDALRRGTKTLDALAGQRRLNVKYLATLWAVLNDAGEVPPSPWLAALRQKWQSCQPADAPRLVAELAEAQKALWKFNSVGHIGREGGPQSWMEPVPVVSTSQELRLKLDQPPAGTDITIYVTASDLGDGNHHDYVVLQRPRFEFKKDDGAEVRPPLPLRDVRRLATGDEGDGNVELPYGLDPTWFGKHPDGSSLDEADLCLQAPRVLEIRLPARLVAGAEFVTTCIITPFNAEPKSKLYDYAQSSRPAPGTPADDGGSVQLQVLSEKPDSLALSLSAPVLVSSGSQAEQRLTAASDEFRDLFPPALCYMRIVPVDEVVTLTLFYREDDHLKRLMLDDQQVQELDRLWDQLYFISQEPIALTVAFEQISEFATQDRPDLVKAFAPLRKPINDRADAFRKRLVEAEPSHINAVLDIASRAWRRDLTAAEQVALRQLYQQLRHADVPHDEAVRLTLARVLTSPLFLYKLEQPPAGKVAAPVSADELATRLSYFLWSSIPDDELRRAARAGKLTSEEELLAQTRRMLADPRTRRLAIQFGCQWLHVRDFDQNNDKNEKLYPEFATLRGDMYEETVRFLEVMFRNDGSILELLDADHTFLNESLARHYGIGGVSGSDWRRVEGIRARGRGGILGMASVLASQSGASRTSPILRGNWISETLLGERLPRPPANVPQLPDTVPQGLTERQLIERHSSVAACAKCHAKIDPYGFALEQYDAIGRLRSEPMDTKATLFDGQRVEGIEGLRQYLLKERRSDVVRQFCRKLLGYALGRELQLSDEPLLAEMETGLQSSDFRFRVAVEAIVTSQQFREIRGASFDPQPSATEQTE